MKREQLELNLPRARELLGLDGPGDDELRERPAKRVSAVVDAGHGPRPEQAVTDDGARFTRWECKLAPTKPGFYELVDHKTGIDYKIWWYQPLAHAWVDRFEELPDGTAVASRLVQHAELMETHAWRGLRERPIDGYTDPHYLRLPLEWRP